MNKIFNKISSKDLILHPFNIIILFLINTSLINLKAGLALDFNDILLAFVIFILYSVIIFFLFNAALKNPVKSSIILSTILFTTLFFRDIYEVLFVLKITEALNFLSAYIGELLFTILLFSIFIALLVIFLYKSRMNFSKLNSYLNLLTIIFIIYELITLASLQESKVDLKENVVLSDEKNSNENPDIFYIILDEYTGFTGLKKFWNYDNSELKTFLLQKGFFIAEKGKTAYTNTNYSLASSLNMTELIYKKENVYEISNYISLANHLKKNKVVNFLYNRGYNFINMSFFDVNNKEKYYQDIYYLKNGNIYQARTIYGHFYEIFNEKFADMANINLEIFEKIVKINSDKSDKPEFVYAHIMMPHPPYYFDAMGNKTSMIYSSDKENLNNYLEQLKYTNRLLIKTIEGLLKSSEKKPVIIVQGDHGFRSYNGKDKLEMEYSVLNSIFFPDGDYSLLTDSLKTVNTFRIIFNKYFNQKLQLIN